jgi:hypothetical protein
MNTYNIMLKDRQQNLPKVPRSDSLSNGTLKAIGTLTVKNKARKKFVTLVK